MKVPSNRDPYTILGVAPDASPEQIRKAYLARSRVIHPDRFDKHQSPDDWLKANEMLAELNDAYAAVKDPVNRQRNESASAQKPPEKSEPERQAGTKTENPSSPHSGFGEPKSGYTEFRSLPKEAQDRLLKRQANSIAGQIKTRSNTATSIGTNLLFLLALGFASNYVYHKIPGIWGRWNVAFWGSITVLVGLLICRNILTIVSYFLATLESAFYLTPLYFIRTHDDAIAFWPIWDLKEVAACHHHSENRYLYTSVTLTFDGTTAEPYFFDKDSARDFVDEIQKYQMRVLSAANRLDINFFLQNDDFHGVPRRPYPVVGGVRGGTRLFLYFLTGILAALVFYDRSVGGIFPPYFFSTPAPPVKVNPSPPPPSFTPAQPPRSAPPAPEVVGPAKREPTYPVRLPPPTPRVVLPEIPEVPLPASGSVWTSRPGERIAPFEITAAVGQHYIVKLVDAYTDNPVMEIFVHSGTTVKVDVPLGTYNVRYASGQRWYGYLKRFGPGTTYSKADRSFSFSLVNRQITGYTITLFPVPNGNLQTSTISANEF
jgi:hypothetical protein